MIKERDQQIKRLNLVKPLIYQYKRNCLGEKKLTCMSFIVLHAWHIDMIGKAKA